MQHLTFQKPSKAQILILPAQMGTQHVHLFCKSVEEVRSVKQRREAN